MHGCEHLWLLHRRLQHGLCGAAKSLKISLNLMLQGHLHALSTGEPCRVLLLGQVGSKSSQVAEARNNGTLHVMPFERLLLAHMKRQWLGS